MCAHVQTSQLWVDKKQINDTAGNQNTQVSCFMCTKVQILINKITKITA